jgi:hypothetical protein
MEFLKPCPRCVETSRSLPSGAWSVQRPVWSVTFKTAFLVELWRIQQESATGDMKGFGFLAMRA